MWDKKGENLTYRFLRLLTEQDRPKLAVIVGDSQTAISGRILEKILKSNDYNVIRNFKAGENTAKTVERLRKINPKSPVDLVVVFTGGNNPSETFSAGRTEQLINTIRQKYGNPQIIFGVAPPATKGDPAKIKKVFGRNSHSEKYSAKRDRMAKAIADKAISMGASFVDPREFMPDPSSITTGDGIHLTGQYANEFASQIANKVDGSLQNTEAPKQVARSFTGKRLSTSELRNMTAEDVVEYAKLRSPTCRNMGYLSINSKGKSVTDIQKALKDKGYDIKDSDGEFGENTLINVIKYQIKSKIRVDGCVGPETMGTLGVNQAQKYVSTGGPVTPANLEEVGKLSQQDVAKIIVKVAEEEGFDPVAALTMARIESGLKPLSNLEKGSYKGLYQFGRQFKKEWAKYGLNWKRGDQFNPEQAARVFMRLMKDRLKNLFPEIKDYSNIPDDKQYFIYLLWQQGPSGAASVKRAADRGGRYTDRQIYENSINNWYSAYPYSAGKRLRDPDTGKTISIEGKNRKQMARELNPARKQRGLKPRKIGSISYLLSKQTFDDQIMRPKDFLNKWERTYARFRKRAMNQYGSHIGQRAIS